MEARCRSSLISTARPSSTTSTPFVFTSYDAPPTIYRCDLDADSTAVWAQPHTAIDLDRIVVRFYASKDGTQGPMFIVRRRAVTAPAATVLHACGGYGTSNVPFYWTA